MPLKLMTKAKALELTVNNKVLSSMRGITLLMARDLLGSFLRTSLLRASQIYGGQRRCSSLMPLVFFWCLIFCLSRGTNLHIVAHVRSTSLDLELSRVKQTCRVSR